MSAKRELLFVIGGARSGKSSYAEELARQLGERVLYVATARAGDAEMEARIAAHRQARLASWRTLEAASNVGHAIRAALSADGADGVLLDCITLLVSNVILGDAWLSEEEYEGVDGRAAAERVEREVDDLVSAYQDGTVSWVVVSNEVGWGLVPPYPVGRIYRDLLGRANQRLAAEADRVYLMVAGLPVDIKMISGQPR
jgi:adenosylcobinamide kinase/adenosylcobinamide-phosphate guanylyltransferase